MGKLTVSLPPFKIEEVFQSFSEVYDWGLRDLHIPDIHRETKGEGITIAIVDSGKTTHFENTHNAGNAHNFSKSPVVEDRNGHSTFISGLIGADANAEGIIGVAPKVQLIFSKAMNDSGTGDPSALTNAINWAVDQKVDIISISAGMFSDFKPMHDAIQRAYQQNIIVVAAAGNTGSRYYDVAFPARYEEVLGIGAYDESRRTATFSSRGINVRFAMPGVDIYSTHLNNSYCRSSGTCLTKNAFIYTPNGPVSIKNVRSGQMVYSFAADGSLKANRVVHQWSRGRKECWSIKTKHHTIEATSNHPVLTFSDEKFVWRHTSELRVGDLIVAAKNIPQNFVRAGINPQDDWNVSLKEPIKPKYGDIPKIKTALRQSSVSGFLSGSHGLSMSLARPIIDYYGILVDSLQFGVGKKHEKITLPIMSAQLAYLCGFYLGDGWITKPKTHNSTKLGRRLYFAKSNRQDVNARMSIALKSVFLIEPRERKNQQYEICNTVVADIFEQLCGYKKARDKTIPAWVYSESSDVQHSFLSGLIDSDGWVTNSGYAISSCSEALICGLASLLDYMGCRKGNIQHRHRKIKAPNSISPTLSDEYSLNFRLDSKATGAKNSECLSFFEQYTSIGTLTSVRTERIASISNIGEQDIFDIEVENNHNFVANKLIVHNSFACPIMSGICALILSKHRKIGGTTPCVTPKDMLQHLEKYSVTLGPKQETGFGTLDLDKMFADGV